MLVDTDVLSFIAWERRQAESFAPLLLGKLLYVSFVTAGEMYFGAEKANWGESRVAKMEAIIRRYTVIPGTYEVAKQYGCVKRAFRDQVDENDMWIAATALERGLPIVTNNLAHFEPMSDRLGFSLVHPDHP
ncbi:PIN domain-containing protein [Candidatus Poriferisocius sp.]|uniref:PIN domain-containing protein n=1 Tax=Candidatus Poriferisocius sp. TaxID=3101276 RepID=UPI003B024EE5